MIIRIYYVFTLLLVGVLHTSAQQIIVHPYLQNAESTSIYIKWETTSSNQNLLAWGLDQNNLDQVVLASSASTNGTNELHEVFIDNLTPDTRYYYSVSSDNYQSEVFDFITPPLADSEQAFNIVAMSDMQKDAANPQKFQELVNDGVIAYFNTNYGTDLPANMAFVMIPGDLVVTGSNYTQWQNDFFGPAQNLFSHVPAYPVLGNHEGNSAYYFQYFTLPENGSAGFEEHWWYKDYSNLRIIGLDSNNGYRIQAQLDWLRSVLNDACSDSNIDFVFAQLHHPHKSELWTPGEIDYTGEIISQLEDFSSNCGKSSIHFFGHTHGYSRGQSRDHQHLWVNVATAGGRIDYWGDYPNMDYEEFSKSIDEYGFVVVNVSAGNNPQFSLRRISRGDEFNFLDNVEQDLITIRKFELAPQTPLAIFPVAETVLPDCVELRATPFTDPGDFHQASHWQISNSCTDFSNPVVESWKQHENLYNESDTQSGDDLFDEEFQNLSENSSYCWRVRYRDSHLKWSGWSTAAPFSTGESQLTANLLLNPGAESGNINNWTIVEGSMEALTAGICNGINPQNGNYYFTVGGLCDGNETSYSEVFQDMDVSIYASSIDQGFTRVVYDAYLSNYNGNDQPGLQLFYLNSSGNIIGSGPLISTLNSNWTYFIEDSFLPANTRTLRMVLTGTRNAGTDNDSYFDNMSLKLDFSQGAGCSEAPLAFEWLEFETQCFEDQIELLWKLLPSHKIEMIHIQMLNHHQEWQTIESIDPAEDLTYSFSHSSALSMEDYIFRLAIEGMDGELLHSKSKHADCDFEKESLVVFPNPVYRSELQIEFYDSKASFRQLHIKDLMGRTLYSKSLKSSRGLNRLNLDLGFLQGGSYWVSLNLNDKILTKQFIINH